MNARCIGWSALALMLIVSVDRAGAQMGNPDDATMLQTSVIEGKATGKKKSVAYYRFNAGPGDVRIIADASTNYYSTFIDIELLSAGDFETIGSLAAAASDVSKRTVKTIAVSEAQPVLLKIATREDATVQSLQYRIRLEGAVDLTTPTAPTAVPVPDVTTADPALITATPIDAATPSDAVAPLPCEPAPPQPTASSSSEGSLAGGLLGQLIPGLAKVPSTGFLNLQMKDGTTQSFDLSLVKRVSVQKAK